MAMPRGVRSVLIYVPLVAGMALAAAVGNENINLRPKTGGTDNDALIQMEIKGVEDDQKADDLLAILNQLPWASRTAVLPRHPGVIPKERWQPKATAAIAIAERQWADVVDLANRAGK